MRNGFPAMPWTWQTTHSTEPANNIAERTLRIAVQLRKIMFGNRSQEEELAMAHLLTVTQTCRIQGRSAGIELVPLGPDHNLGAGQNNRRWHTTICILFHEEILLRPLQ